MHFAITGRPRIGKTTVLLRVVEELRRAGCTVGGMLTQETRRRGVRVGFEVLDIAAQKKGWLAHVDGSAGPRLGKYHVNVQDLEEVGVSAILNAAKTQNIAVVVIDEVGPMELFSERFKEAFRLVFEGRKPAIVAVHYRVRDPIIDMIRRGENVSIVEVTLENLDRLHRTLSASVLKYVEGRNCSFGSE